MGRFNFRPGKRAMSLACEQDEVVELATKVESLLGDLEVGY